MRPLEQPPELALRRESVHRCLLELYDDQDRQSLLAHAETLNELWIQQCTINRWLAHEAAENLSLAVNQTAAASTPPSL
jgi:hypothetical protein